MTTEPKQEFLVIIQYPDEAKGLPYEKVEHFEGETLPKSIVRTEEGQTPTTWGTEEATVISRVLQNLFPQTTVTLRAV